MRRVRMLLALAVVPLLGLVATPTAVLGGTDATHAGFPASVAAAEELLFVQIFESGAFRPKSGEAGVFELALAGGGDQTLYFANRPARDVGTLPTEQLLPILGFGPVDPPNAAVVAQTAAGEYVLVVELLNPRFDAAAGTLTYDARPLAEYQGEALASLAARQDGQGLPEAFGPISLFIDYLCPV